MHNQTGNSITSAIGLLTRRGLLRAALSAGLVGTASTGRAALVAPSRFAALERSLGARLGVWAIDTADGAAWGWRGSERFPFCSTFKMMLASAILQKSRDDAGLLQQRILFGRSDFASYSPITEKHVEGGMTVAELCAAAIQYSDNTAANLLIRRLGGPAAVTAFARSIGDRAFRLDRWETALNTAIPGDPRDTTTPEAMATSLRRLALGGALGNVLGDGQRELLQGWLRGNTTGARRIRAGVPAEWMVGDKTGTGSHGTANDVAVLWPPDRAPIVLAVYTTRPRRDAKPLDDAVAEASRLVLEPLRR